ncbi:protein NipSnap homolog 3A isoform X1 [Seriola aureovittata]|uniref:Nipsnap homolog 3A (C. elegans) n=2 Tax=Seriola lalandi dorsalis TaxID=1841481 RepID=A0A3B4XZ32_SERLL|nr:protein NipSnap homolog 3A isoform X1 [Seriola aureovittata]
MTSSPCSLFFCHFSFNMLKLRSSSLRSAAALITPAAAQVQSVVVVPDLSCPLSGLQPRVHLSTGPQQNHKTFYEFRTYCIRPDQNAAFLKLTNEKIHLRTAHSQLIGYWSVEYGGLNQVFHIWKYDSYSQRAAVRSALSQDPSWISEYISKAIPMLTSQDNEITYLVPWSRLQKPQQEGGVYELVSYQMRPGGPAVWGNTFQAAVTSHDAPGYGKLVGAFHSEFGQLNRVHTLWWFESADQRAEVRHKSHSDARVVAAVRNSVVHLDSQKNKLMFPCPFSPMK